MAEAVQPSRPSSSPIPGARRSQLGWLLGMLIKPKETLARITALHVSAWLIPLLVLSLTSLLFVGASGHLRQTAASMGEVQLPPDFQWWSQEQQAQFMQATQATSGPVFLYVFPALVSLGKIWLGWLLVGGMVHLILTMLGGRGNIGTTLNLIAWGGLPFALRDLVRVTALLAGQRLIQSPGISGFAPVGEGFGFAFLAAFMASIDIYLVWQIVLLTIGGRMASNLPTGKVLFGVFLTLLLVLSISAAAAAGQQQMSGLTIIRPFF